MDAKTTIEIIADIIDSAKILKNRIQSSNELGLIPFSAELRQEQSDLKREIEVWFDIQSMKLLQKGLEALSNKLSNKKIQWSMDVLPGEINKQNHGALSDVINFLSDYLLDLESRQSKKTIITLTIEDLDDFKPFILKSKGAEIDSKFYNSAFLEDDIKCAFLRVIDEFYKENDSPSETRDLYTNKIRVNGRRLNSVVMFKGRGLKGPMYITNAGKYGNQLLKLAKNSYAELFIVQHVNKIDPDVIEAFMDHLCTHSKHEKIYLCIINGQDTAQLLFGMGYDLDELLKK